MSSLHRFVKPSSHLTKLNSKMDTNTWLSISQVAIAIGIFLTAIGTYGAYHFGKKIDSKKAEEQKESQLASEQRIISSLSDSLKQIKSSASSEQVDRADRGLPGLAFQAVFTIHTQTEKRDKYLMDMGDALNRNRVSLYLDENNDLIYRIIDDIGTPHIIRVSQGINTFQPEAKYLFTIDYGLSPNYSFMRLFINDREVGRHEIQGWLKLVFRGPTDPDISKTMLIGCDISKHNFAKFTVAFSAIYKGPMAKQDYKKMFEIWASTMDKIK
jgi:hypothetical protein